ncbi:serine hydrolase-like protein 2 [Tupaia chinensis]|uniref:serine hydrolase-like protein 2 n=1 Tax=Tupaia chinensis TaxID=246437 RepID=UPI000FFB75B9|nr:serine hydrolase-like protein 2 [Tupaia chinensis]
MALKVLECTRRTAQFQSQLARRMCASIISTLSHDFSPIKRTHPEAGNPPAWRPLGGWHSVQCLGGSQWLEVGAPGDRPASPGLLTELKLAVPWGHIAAKAWGSRQGPPVLCLHGWLDNANSFDRLIPLLPQEFHYVAMDFGGHGLSSHYSPGIPYYYQNFVNEIRRVVATLKWNRFTLLGHSFGGTVGGMFSCVFPEMVDKLILLDATPFALDSNEVENVLTYKRRAIEHTLQVEASQKPSQVLSPEEMLQGFLKNNSQVGEECGRLLLQRGTTQVGTGLKLNRDRRVARPENSFEFVSKELFMQFIKKLQARILFIKALQGYYNVRRENDTDRDTLYFMVSALQSTLKERFQFVEVPGNHYVHMKEPEQVAGLISNFLKSEFSVLSQL